MSGRNEEFKKLVNASFSNDDQKTIVFKATEAAGDVPDEPTQMFRMFFPGRLAQALRRTTEALRRVACLNKPGSGMSTECAFHMVEAMRGIKYIDKLISNDACLMRRRHKFSLIKALISLVKNALNAAAQDTQMIGTALETTPYNDMCTKNAYWRPDVFDEPTKRGRGGKRGLVLEGDLVMSAEVPNGESAIVGDFRNCEDGSRFVFEGVALQSIFTTEQGIERFQPFGVGAFGKCAIRHAANVPVKCGDLMTVAPNHGIVCLLDETGERYPACAALTSFYSDTPDLFMLSPASPGSACLVLVLP